MEDVQSDSAPSEQLFMAPSNDAITGLEGPRTMRLVGHIQGQEVLILVDSGSSHTFLSDQIARKLVEVQSLDKSMSVQVANGGLLLCSANIPAAQWSVGDYSFTTDMKIL